MKNSPIKKERKRLSTQRRCPKPCSLVPFKSDLPRRKAIPSFWSHTSQETICLHLGENPFPPTERILNAISETAKNANRYPDTNANRLREVLAEYAGHSVTPDNIIVGNGSDELIDLTVLTFMTAGKRIATFEPTFFVYSFAAKRHGFRVLTIQRNHDYSLPDPNDLFESQEEELENISLSFIANPNNPTGNLSSREIILAYIENMPGIVVVDECYFEFCQETVVDKINDFSNLIVFRSLSKSFGLSGLRLGYAVASKNLIEAINRHALTFPVNALAQAAGIAALQDKEVYFERIDELKQQREYLREEISKLGFDVVPSHTNFILAIWQWEQKEMILSQELANRGILVSDQTGALGTGKQAIRIAVGTKKENSSVVKALSDLCQQGDKS